MEEKQKEVSHEADCRRKETLSTGKKALSEFGSCGSEVMEENLKKLKLGLIPYVEDKEMKEIEKIFGRPEKCKKQEFIKQVLYNVE